MAKGDRPFEPDPAALWAHLSEAEQHLDRLQLVVRIGAALLGVAAFAAIVGLLLSRLTVAIPVEVLAFAVSLAASTGVLLLWALDVLVYERRRAVLVEEGTALERRVPSLPQVHSRLAVAGQGGPVAVRVAGFYVGLVVMPLLVGGGLLLTWCARLGPLALAGVGAGVVGLAIALGTLVWLRSVEHEEMPGGRY